MGVIMTSSGKDAATDLVTGAKNGDAQAWDALIEEFTPLIWSVCRRFRLYGADAEDVCQAVWLRLVEHLDNLRAPAALPGWLSTTSQRECWRVLRTRVTLPCDGQLLENMPDEQTVTAEHQLLAVEGRASLREAFARLPLRCRQLLAMLLLADSPVPYTEISARLGIPIGSIGPNRRRYLDRLRRDPAIARLINVEAAEAGG
jgi:RNA polymerase sigma factor (sigma-70 family)